MHRWTGTTAALATVLALAACVGAPNVEAAVAPRAVASSDVIPLVRYAYAHRCALTHAALGGDGAVPAGVVALVANACLLRDDDLAPGSPARPDGRSGSSLPDCLVLTARHLLEHVVGGRPRHPSRAPVPRAVDGDRGLPARWCDG